ncbi:hypothetical protein [Nannocystis bainbridge]|uniref:Uncharacterized protein n=1 Tax=Nannocystis bainbridge TaxID=2995303 RepID=A0ABT5E5J5_9BACT|nr:hypothetical protein [Nannocystis bainbridge]MDC0720680.1 hypothetical protein [Nannocystis bainbridge]
MSVLDLVREETGLDLSNAKLTVDKLAPAFAERIDVVLHDLDRALEISRKIMDAYRMLLVAPSPVAAIGVAYNAIKSAWGYLQGEANKKAAENLERRAATRAAFVARYYTRGAWSQVCMSSKAPTPKALDLTKGTKKAGAHLSQYDPYYVWHASRVAQSQILMPTWSGPPYDEPVVQPDLWEKGFSWPEPTLLGGFRGLACGEPPGVKQPNEPCALEVWWDKPAPVGPIPGAYVEKYWGNAPNKGSPDAANVLDASVLVRGYAPPPGYTYLFSWGTYPWSGWQGPPGGSSGSPIFDKSADMAALAAAIHSLTPLHAQIPWDDVARAYRHFVQVSGWRKLKPLPDKQVDAGVYLDAERLPTSTSALPLPIPETGYPWEVIREIELLFRSFFRIRRAAIYQWAFTSDQFKAACKTSRDPLLRTLANGAEPPEHGPWKAWDPLGEGWDGGMTEPAPQAGKPPGPGVWGSPKNLTAGPGPGEVVAVAAGGYLLYRLFL